MLDYYNESDTSKSEINVACVDLLAGVTINSNDTWLIAVHAIKGPGREWVSKFRRFSTSTCTLEYLSTRLTSSHFYKNYAH